MTRDEIVAALRICASGVDCAKGNCAYLEPNGAFGECTKKKDRAAADLIENQQRHIEALMKANGSLKDAIARRDKQIEDMKQEVQATKNTAEQYAAINDTLYDSNMKLGADRKALINELCQYCGKYKQAHEGACDGCRWGEM